LRSSLAEETLEAKSDDFVDLILILLLKNHERDVKVAERTFKKCESRVSIFNLAAAMSD